MTAIEVGPTRTGAALPLLAQRRTPCLARLDASRPWRAVRAYAVGGRVIGIRAASRLAEDQLDTRLQHLRLPDEDYRARPNLSIELSEDDDGGRRGLHLLYRDHVVVARRRAVDALMTDVDTVVRSLALLGGGAPVVRASVLLGPYGSATLLPPGWHATLVMRQRRLAAEGLTVLPTREHLVSDLDEPVLLRPSSDGSTRHVITAWGVRRDSGGVAWLRPAEAVLAAFPTVSRTELCGPREALRFLASVVPQVPVVALPAADGNRIVTLARDLTA